MGSVKLFHTLTKLLGAVSGKDVELAITTAICETTESILMPLDFTPCMHVKDIKVRTYDTQLLYVR